MRIGDIGGKEINTRDFKITGKENFDLNSIVRSALLLTLTGYFEKDSFLVEGKGYYKQDNLSKFFSYLLNDKRAAPRKFDLNIDFSEKQFKKKESKSNSYDCILAFSGGIDSTAGLLYALDKGKRVKPVWIGFGQKNEEKEIRVVKEICSRLNIEPIVIKIDLKKYVDEGWSHWKMGIIPARNFLFSAIASSIANNSTKKKVAIYICAHKEEVNPVNTDKSMRFFETGTNIFKEAYKKDIVLTSPFIDTTKPEILNVWINSWQNKYRISPQDTISCYYGNNCGNCKACINRAVVFSCVGLPLENFKANPFLDKEKIIKDAYVSRFNHLKYERKLDFLYAMKINEKDLSRDLRVFLNTEWPKYENKAFKHIRKIRSVKEI